MLVLTRKNRQQIQIGENVTITILKVKGNSVQIGIDAPQDVKIMRSEVPTFSMGPSISESQDLSPRIEQSVAFTTG